MPSEITEIRQTKSQGKKRVGRPRSALKYPKQVREPIRGLVPASSYGVLDKTYNEYLGALDPRGTSTRGHAVRVSLAAHADNRFRVFLARLSETRFKRYSLAAIAKGCNISLTEFADFWQKSQNMRTLALAQDGLFDVTSDIITDAKSKPMACERCDGFGWLYVDSDLAAQPGVRRLVPRDKESKQIRACPTCKGTCLVTKSGDTDSRRMLMDIAGVGGRKGSAVTINATFGSQSTMDKLSKTSFDISDDADAPVIDVDPA